MQEAKDIHGREVLTAYAAVARLGWLVFVEMVAPPVESTQDRPDLVRGVVLMAAGGKFPLSAEAAQIAQTILDHSRRRLHGPEP